MVIIFKKEKTNWRYLAIVFVLGILVGAGTIWLTNSL
jgi:hypothetical protein